MDTAEVNIPQVLLVGDIDRAFLYPEAVRGLGCQICARIGDAVDAAARSSFGVIAVVVTGLIGELDMALEAFRDCSVGTRIILLAQMYEEPLAIQLVNSVRGGVSLADDYLICPIEAEHFCEVAAVGPREVPEDVCVSAESRIRHLEKLATEDDLTGLKNRRYIWEFARQVIGRAKVREEQVTLLLFDVDNLKSYNDVYGHLAGDEILKEVAVLMRRCCRGHDVVGRIGGDEFAVVFWNEPKGVKSGAQTERRSIAAEHPREAILVANRFRSELKKAKLKMLGPDGRGILTISGALASFPSDGSTIGELFQQADQALLEVKRSGKNKIYLVGEPESDISNVQ